MKKILFVFLIVILNNLVFCHRQHVHQFITAEAYQLLKLCLGYDIPQMANKVGGVDGLDVGTRPWEKRLLTTGA